MEKFKELLAEALEREDEIKMEDNFRDYDEWIVDCGSYKVKIDLVCYYLRDNNYDYTYSNNVSYHYYTDADYLNALLEKINENAAVDNDL